MTLRSRTALMLLSAMSAFACAAPATVVAPAKLSVTPFQPLGVVGGTTQTFAYNSAMFTYTQFGTIRWNSDASNGSYTPGDNNTITFSFFGAGLHLYGSLQARGCPAIPVVVDGTNYTMSCYLGLASKIFPQFDQTLLDIPSLPIAVHNVTITNPIRGKYIYFTRAVVDLPPPVSATANYTPGVGYSGPPVWGP